MSEGGDLTIKMGNFQLNGENNEYASFISEVGGVDIDWANPETLTTAMKVVQSQFLKRLMVETKEYIGSIDEVVKRVQNGDEVLLDAL